MDSEERARLRQWAAHDADDGDSWAETALSLIEALDAAERECDAARAEVAALVECLALADAVINWPKARPAGMYDAIHRYRHARAALAATAPKEGA